MGGWCRQHQQRHQSQRPDRGDGERRLHIYLPTHVYNYENLLSEQLLVKMRMLT
jgi:hypothetical protein